jgi:MoaA/NifB/PqqE/SkfB family radical SAM enzyme
VAISIDIELTNRCNASCYFCPRDQTPHQGTMTPEVFTKSLERAVEWRELLRPVVDQEPVVSLCGLGEPLLNKHAAEFVRQVRAEDFACAMSSNGALLDERRGRALLDAGLSQILINVGERGDDYEDIYKLPWEKTRDNVVRFHEMAGDRCQVQIVLVNHRADADHQAEMREFWTGLGIEAFREFEIMNRGGALFVDHMQFESLPELGEARRMLEADGHVPLCGVPFLYLFVGYDGQYYLCCSDWKKEVPLGSVFDESFISIAREKLRHVVTRESVCRTCNLDPVNRLTEELHALAAGQATQADIDDLVAEIRIGSRMILDGLDSLWPGSSDTISDYHPPRRRTIPVTAL